MVQVAVLDGLQFDGSPSGGDGFATTKIDGGVGMVANPLVEPVDIEAADESGDGGVKASLHKIGCPQDGILSVWCQRSTLSWVWRYIVAQRTLFLLLSSRYLVKSSVIWHEAFSLSGRHLCGTLA